MFFLHRYRVVFSFMSFALFLGLAFPCVSAESEKRSGALEILTERFKTIFVPSGLDVSNPAVKAAIRDVDVKAESVISSQNMDKSSKDYGSWGKLKKRDGDKVKRFVNRTYKMTRAWAFPYSKYYKKKESADPNHGCVRIPLPLYQAGR